MRTLVSLFLTAGLGPGPVCTGSTTVLAEGAARVPVLLTVYVRPIMTPHYTAETQQNSRRKEQRGHAEQLEREERDTGRDTMSTMDEAASTTDGLGCVDPDGAPGVDPLMESSPATAAAAAAAGVEVVSASNRIFTFLRPRFRKIVAIRYSTL